MDLDEIINKSIDDMKKAEKNTDFCQDQGKKSDLAAETKPTKNKVGAKNRGKTKQRQENHNSSRLFFRHIKQDDTFNSEIIEKVQGEIIEDNKENFKELYSLTCYSIYDDFKSKNPDIVKRHPYTWYKPLLVEIKRNVPLVKYDELDKLIAIWDVLRDFLSYIGLYITYETFQDMTKVYDYQLKKMEGVNPKYIDFRQKIRYERDTALLNELQYNPFNQTNKIFIAKTHGIIEKTEPKTIEVNHNFKKVDDIPIFGIEENSGN